MHVDRDRTWTMRLAVPVCVAAIGWCTDGARADVETLYTFRAPLGEQINGLSTARDGRIYATTWSGGDANLGAVIHRERSGRVRLVYSFRGGDQGARPNPEVAIDEDGNLYGTTSIGGIFGYGTAYRIRPCGTFTTLHHFTIDDGGAPRAPLLLASDGHLYGTTAGVFWNPESHMNEIVSRGAVFRLARSGAFTLLHQLGESDGMQPLSALMQASDGHLYGTTSAFQFSDVFHPINLSWGSVFRITRDGEFTTLHTFQPIGGGNPRGRLVQASDGYLYGTTAATGDWQTAGTPGTVFRISLEGGLESLATFYDPQGLAAEPHEGLVEGEDGRLYGTARGGANGRGALFAVTPDGQLTALHAFAPEDGAVSTALIPAADGGWFVGTQTRLLHVTQRGEVSTMNRLGYEEGSGPLHGVILGRDGNYYGTTSSGGPNNGGTVFRLTAAGKLTTIYAFRPNGGVTAWSWYVEPGPLIQADDGALYGTTRGGDLGTPTIFRLTPSGEFSVLYTFPADEFGWALVPKGPLVQGGDRHLYGIAGGFGDTPIAFRFDLGTNTFTQFGVLVDGEIGVTLRGALFQAEDGNFYGAGSTGGVNAWSGLLFRLTPAGTFTNLHSFLDEGGPEGRVPVGLLQGENGMFYSATLNGGVLGGGTVFEMTPAGEIRVLHAFSSGTGPDGPLLLGDAGALYGEFARGGAFVVRPDGTYSTLAELPGLAGTAGLIRGADGRLYGTRSPSEDGDHGGIVYAIDP